MTLEEAIKHYEKLAEAGERDAQRWVTDGWQSSFKSLTPEREAQYLSERKRLYNQCLKCAKEHRQLAEWLKELKAYRKAKKKIIDNMKAWEKIYHEPLEWNVEDINSIKLAFYQDGKADAYTDCIGICEIAFEEVNADADSD